MASPKLRNLRCFRPTNAASRRYYLRVWVGPVTRPPVTWFCRCAAAQRTGRIERRSVTRDGDAPSPSSLTRGASMGHDGGLRRSGERFGLPEAVSQELRPIVATIAASALVSGAVRSVLEAARQFRCNIALALAATGAFRRVSFSLPLCRGLSSPCFGLLKPSPSIS